MDARTFSALLRLLDDPHFTVKEAVDAQLSSLGMMGITRLETAWEQASPIQQERLEEIIQHIQISHHTDALGRWFDEGAADLMEGWLSMTQLQYPTLNLAKYRSEIQRLFYNIWTRFGPVAGEKEKLLAINRQLYLEEQFNGQTSEPERPDTYYLNPILDQRIGNPLSLSVLYLAICQEFDISVELVDFGGFYALRYQQTDVHFYIDAYNRGVFFSPHQLRRFLRQFSLQVDVMEYASLSNGEVMLHLLEGLARAWGAQGVDQKAELYLEVMQRLRSRR